MTGLELARVTSHGFCRVERLKIGLFKGQFLCVNRIDRRVKDS